MKLIIIPLILLFNFTIFAADLIFDVEAGLSSGVSPNLKKDGSADMSFGLKSPSGENSVSMFFGGVSGRGIPLKSQINESNLDFLLGARWNLGLGGSKSSHLAIIGGKANRIATNAIDYFSYKAFGTSKTNDQKPTYGLSMDSSFSGLEFRQHIMGSGSLYFQYLNIAAAKKQETVENLNIEYNLPTTEIYTIGVQFSHNLDAKDTSSSNNRAGSSSLGYDTLNVLANPIAIPLTIIAVATYGIAIIPSAILYYGGSAAYGALTLGDSKPWSNIRFLSGITTVSLNKKTSDEFSQRGDFKGINLSFGNSKSTLGFAIEGGSYNQKLPIPATQNWQQYHASYLLVGPRLQKDPNGIYLELLGGTTNDESLKIMGVARLGTIIPIGKVFKFGFDIGQIYSRFNSEPRWQNTYDLKTFSYQATSHLDFAF